jgi:FAD synthetase
MTTVMVFGTFDGIHPGHEAFLKQARELGDRLVAAVAPDKVVEKLKNRRTKEPENKRLESIEKLVDKAVLGDVKIGAFQSVKQLNPDIIALGYDQDSLEEKLIEWIEQTGSKIKVVKLKPFKSDIYKSSIINKTPPEMA